MQNLKNNLITIITVVKNSEQTIEKCIQSVLNQKYDNIEWDAGVVFGSRITKSLGMFIEGTHMKYWDKPVYEVKFGFNYLIF